MDEDAFILDPQAVLDLVGTLLEGGYANIGCSDGDPATTGRDATVTNPFFNVFDLTLIRSRFDRSLLKPQLDDAEPYYPFFHWLADTFPTLYLPCRKHTDGITTMALDPQGRTLCFHTWFSRFYSMPSWIVRRIEPSQGMQRQRIDAIIHEAYQLRGKELHKEVVGLIGKDRRGIGLGFGEGEELALGGPQLLRQPSSHLHSVVPLQSR